MDEVVDSEAEAASDTNKKVVEEVHDETPQGEDSIVLPEDGNPAVIEKPEDSEAASDPSKKAVVGEPVEGEEVADSAGAADIDGGAPTAGRLDEADTPTAGSLDEADGEADSAIENGNQANTGEKNAPKAMKPVHRHRQNYNEEGDVTKPQIRQLMENGNPFGIFVKVVRNSLGFDLAEEVDKLTDRRDQSRVFYRPSEIFFTDCLSECMGIYSGRGTDEAMNFTNVIDNIAFFCGYEGLDRIPDRATREDFYATIDVDELRAIQYKIAHALIASRRYEKYRFEVGGAGGTKAYPLILDATQTAFFTERHCPCCYRQKIKEDEKGNPVYGYSHKVLTARLVLSDRISMILDWEPIEGNEEDRKQDCETGAAKTLLGRIRKKFLRTNFLLQGDSLYATAPMLSLAKNQGMEALFTVKEGSQRLISDEAMKIIERGEAQHKYWRDGQEEGTIYWINDIGNEAGKNLDFPLSFVRLELNYEVKGKAVKVAKPTEHPNGWRHYVGKELSKDPANAILTDKKEDGENGNATGKAKGGKKTEAEKREDDAVAEVMKRVDALKEEGVFSGAKKTAHGCEVYVKEETAEDGTVTTQIKVVFSWLATFEITEDNARATVKRGRKRWIIETSYNNLKHGTLRIEHLKGYDPNAMQVHFWETSLADLMLQLYFAYDKVPNESGLSAKSMQMALYVSCRIKRMFDWEEEFFKPMNLVEKERRSA